MDPVAGVVEQACTSGSCGHVIIRVVAVEWQVRSVQSRVCVCVPVKPTRNHYVVTRGCATTT